MTSRLTVLGSSGAWPEAGRACSGFLLEHDGFSVVVDLGYGTVGRLLAAVGSTVGDHVDAIVVTHRHPDHAADLHALMRARWFGRRDAAPLPLYAPEGVLELVRRMQDDGNADPGVVSRVFDWRPLPAPAYAVGPFELTSRAVPHWVPTAGVRLAAPGLVVTYTGDAGDDPALLELARDADLLVAEANDADQQTDDPGGESGMHLSGREAGALAERAGVRRLLLTHFWPGNDRERTAADARRGFSGEVVVADEGLVLPLP